MHTTCNTIKFNAKITHQVLPHDCFTCGWSLLNVVFLLVCFQVPTTNPEELRHWMYRLYIEKEAMLEEFYRTGVFPHKMFDKQANPPTGLWSLTRFFYNVLFRHEQFYWALE